MSVEAAPASAVAQQHAKAAGDHWVLEAHGHLVLVKNLESVEESTRGPPLELRGFHFEIDPVRITAVTGIEGRHVLIA
jgi:hypothetical protein